MNSEVYLNQVSVSVPHSFSQGVHILVCVKQILRFALSVTIVVNPNSEDLSTVVLVDEVQKFGEDALRILNTNEDSMSCPKNYVGKLTHKKNCREFVDCYYGTSHVMPCAAHLLFNNHTKQCDYPEEANCCEFWEEDSSKLVTFLM
ncbi:hypothetical protein RI129_002276 [Pyrocoelia pectoralis]|uniref:Chitin-binding type-2 domain-containing protein n=1 Tax=Pyrocoelia pectoralis TaxID=417401 RepID=A0AAN7VNI2_9COLE